MRDATKQIQREEKLLSHFTRKGREDSEDLNQSRTVPVIPNHEERRDNKILWSTVSNAAERSKRQRHDIFESL